MFGVPIEGMDPGIRRRAKAINFGIVYGISSVGLAAQLGIARSEAGAYIKTYFERFPGIRDYMEAMKAEARRQGYVKTLFGRKVHYPRDQHQEPVAARQLRARRDQRADPGLGRRHHPPRHDPHGTGACRSGGLSARMLMQVHDELVFEAPEGEVEKTMEVAQPGHGERRRSPRCSSTCRSRSTPAPATTGKPRIRVSSLGGSHGQMRAMRQRLRPELHRHHGRAHIRLRLIRMRDRGARAVCPHCGVRIVGHGVQHDDSIFCCVHCAKHEGVKGLRDRD